MEFREGDLLTIAPHISDRGKGLRYGRCVVRALEAGFTGGWDVWNVEHTVTGITFSVYGFSIDGISNMS